MNTHRLYKIKTTFYDVVLALLMFLFFTVAVASTTIGNADFYNRFLGKEEITVAVQNSLNERTKEIAKETGIEQKAFEFAVGQNKIKTLQKEIIKSAFSGVNYDYSESSNISGCYRDGITEFYRFNGLELDKDALDRAVPLACDAFNKSMGIDNNVEFSTFASRLGKTAVMLALAFFVLSVALAVFIFVTLGGRTRVFGHYGCALISSGLSLIALFGVNAVDGFSENMYLTENAGVNIALADAFNLFFVILACFGAALVIGGYSLLVFVYRYYVSKFRSQNQEHNITKDLLIGSTDGDISISQIVSQADQENNSL